MIGVEIAAADHSVEKSELPSMATKNHWKTSGLISMVAHEIIHTQQYDNRKIIFKSNALIEQTMKEGAADFLTSEILLLNLNKVIYNYGMQNECSLLKDFKGDLDSDPIDYSNWL